MFSTLSIKKSIFLWLNGISSISVCAPEVKTLKKMFSGCLKRVNQGSAAIRYWAAIELDCLVPATYLLPSHLLIFSSSWFLPPCVLHLHRSHGTIGLSSKMPKGRQSCLSHRKMLAWGQRILSKFKKDIGQLERCGTEQVPKRWDDCCARMAQDSSA